MPRAGLYVDDEFIGAVSDGDELLLSLKSRRDGTYQPGVPVSELQPAEEETTQPEETTDLIPFTTPEILLLMALQMEETVDWIAERTVEMTVLIAFHAVLIRV